MDTGELPSDCVDVSLTSADWTEVTVTLTVLPDVTVTSPFVSVLPDTETEGAVADVVPGVCPDVTATRGVVVDIVAFPTDVRFVMLFTVDWPVNCVPVMDILVVSGALDDGPVVGDDSMDCTVRSVMRVDTPVAPVPVKVFLLVCSP